MFTQLTKKAVPIQLYTMFSSPSKQNPTQKTRFFWFLWKILPPRGFFSTIFWGGWVFAIYPKAPNEALQPEGGEAKFKAKPSWMTTRWSGKHNVIASRRGVGRGTSTQKNGHPKENPKVTMASFHFARAKWLIAMFVFACWEEKAPSGRLS